MEPETLLHELRNSELFTPGFPKRARYTRAQWALLPEPVRFAAQEQELLARRRVKDVNALVEVVRALGEARYSPAVPVLASLWADCALPPVRLAAGQALRAIGGPEARAALESLLEDTDRMSIILAVWAIFDADARAAFERFAPHFEPESIEQPGGAMVPGYVLRTFVPSAFPPGPDGAPRPVWSEPRAPGWLEEDPRWLVLLDSHRDDDGLFSHTASTALEYAAPELVARVLGSSYSRQEPSVSVRTAAAGDLVARYLRGEHEEVWDELREPEAIAGDFREEALAVARETMRRVARAADLLAARLSQRGWKALSGSLRVPPAPGDAEIISTVVRFTRAPLPPSLLSFWEVVGGIDFIWDFGLDAEPPDLGVGLELQHMDPLAVKPPRDVAHLFELWELECRDAAPGVVERFELTLAPDSLMKARISGSTYGIELPFAGADPVFAPYAYELPFVDYLRHCVRWAGFPRLEQYEDDARVEAFVAELTRDLEPF